MVFKKHRFTFIGFKSQNKINLNLFLHPSSEKVFLLKIVPIQSNEIDFPVVLDMNEESPPEPAPPEVPPRGPSLHAAATLRRRQEYAVPVDATTASAGSSGNEHEQPHFLAQGEI